MNLWETFSLKHNTKYENQGLSFHYEKGIDDKLKKEYIAFSRWLRKNYVFPVHMHIYILNSEKVRLLNGSMAYGSFRWFPKRNPRIKIPSAVEAQLLGKYTKEELYDQILSSFIHELTHYYQWVLDLDQDSTTSERQANYFRYRILDMFYDDTNCYLQSYLD